MDSFFYWFGFFSCIGLAAIFGLWALEMALRIWADWRSMGRQRRQADHLAKKKDTAE